MKTWYVLLQLVRFRPSLFALAVLSGVGVFGLPMALGLVLRAFFDALTGAAPAGWDIQTVLAFFVATRLAELIADEGLSYGWVTFRDTSIALLRRNALREAVCTFGCAAHAVSPGEALGRLRGDVTEVVESVDAWIDMIGRTVFVTAAVAVLLGIDPFITAVVLVPMTVVVTAVNLLEERLVRFRQAAQAAGSAVSAVLGELFGAVQVLKVSAAVPHAVRYLREVGEARRKASMRDHVFRELLEGFNWNVANLGTGVILLLAARAMREASFSVGDFALFVVYLDQIVYFPLEIARLLTTYKQAGVSVRRLEEAVGGAKPERLVSHEPLGTALVTLPEVPAREPLRELRVEGLVCRYPGAERVAGPIDLTLRAGTVTVLTGRIGSGKSTLVQALLGLVPTESGRVLWNGVPLDPGRGDLAQSAAYTPQVPRLFSESVRDNVVAGLPESEDRLEGAIHAAVLERDIPHLEHGLDTVVGPRGVRLSGGQIQRTAAARMFARDAQLYVLDDLSSALDVETERTLWDRLYARRAHDAATYLVISHRAAALERADQVITLEDGRVAADV